jgi:hypothetical protein
MDWGSVKPIFASSVEIVSSQPINENWSIFSSHFRDRNTIVPLSTLIAVKRASITSIDFWKLLFIVTTSNVIFIPGGLMHNNLRLPGREALRVTRRR